MSSDEMSDAGDVGEGEGPKVVQSSFRDASIMNKSVAVKEPPSASPVPDAASPDHKPSSALKPEPLKSTKKPGKRFVDSLNFETPKFSGIPILNKTTTNPNTFDLNFLLNPDVQKLAKSSFQPEPLKLSSTPAKKPAKNLIKKNILNTKAFSGSKSLKDLPEIPLDLELKAQPRTKLDVEERFYKKAKKTEEKIKNLKELKELQEVNSCTFKPQIKAKREQKTYEEFYEYMKRHSEKKEKKIQMIKEEEKRVQNEKNSEFSFQPKLCEKSIMMHTKQSDLEQSTYERLHKLYKGKSGSGRESVVSEAKSDDVSFQPTVNKRSQMMSRTGPVDKILYDDALRRINKDKNPPRPPPSKFITVKSEKVLIEKLKRDFEEAFAQIDSELKGMLNYTKTIELLKLMKFIRDDNKREEERLLLLDLWKVLSGEGENMCSKNAVLEFLIAVMGFYEEWMGNAEAAAICLSDSDANRIHIKFDLFYTNRVSMMNKSASGRSEKFIDECTFTPQLIAESEQLAKNRRAQRSSNERIEDILIAEKQKRNQRLSDLRAVMEEQLLDECSFQPIIESMPEEFRGYYKEDLTAEYLKMMEDPQFQNKHKGLILHCLAKLAQERKDVKFNEIMKQRQEKEMENCTFAPKLEERLVIETDAYEPRKAEKAVVKEKSAFKKEVKKQAVKTKVEEKKGIEEKWPKLESNNGKVAVYQVLAAGVAQTLEFDIENDDPAAKVMEFSKKYALNKEQEYKLVKELTLMKTSI